MKILYLHQHFATREGSAGTRSYEFARLLIEGGHQVTIICGWSDRSGLPKPSGKLSGENWLDGIYVIQIKVPYNQKMGILQRMLSFIWFMLLSCWVALRQPEIDVIFATSTPLTIAVPAIIVSAFKRRPFVFEVRDLWPGIPISLGLLNNQILITAARGMEKLAYFRAKQIVALSPGMKEGIIRIGVAADKICVIPNACDNELFSVSPETGIAFRQQHHLPDYPLVVYTGAFGKVNNVSYLVRLAHQMWQRGNQVGFLLIGEGREQEECRKLAEQLGVLNLAVWIMDALPRKEMPVILSAATMATSTIIDNPILWHNSANKFFDALAAGRPIVINHRGWMADLLEKTGAGIVLPPKDFESAADKLRRFITSESRMAQAQIAAKKLAETEFDRRQLARSLEKILQEAMAT